MPRTVLTRDEFNDLIRETCRSVSRSINHDKADAWADEYIAACAEKTMVCAGSFQFDGCRCPSSRLEQKRGGLMPDLLPNFPGKFDTLAGVEYAGRQELGNERKRPHTITVVG